MFNDKAAWGDFSQSSLYKSWKLACRAADVPFFNPYKLRHSYATALRAEGIDLADVQTARPQVGEDDGAVRRRRPSQADRCRRGTPAGVAQCREW